jgi:hypothetical protein
MRFHEVIRKRIEHESGGVSLAGVLSAAVTANVRESGAARTRVATRERIVQGTRKSDQRRRQP